MRLHHLGIVVPRIRDSIGDLANYMKFETISNTMPVGSQKVNICFLKVGEPFLELIEPVEKDSPVYDFAKNGG